MILNDNLLKKVLVMVLAGGQGEKLYPLTKDRAKPAVPFGGIYRIIDFTLSNCANSELFVSMLTSPLNMIGAGAFCIEATLRETLKRMDPTPHNKLLDIGCGTGSLLQVISRNYPSFKIIYFY
jgi:hypothetical protein